MGSSLKRVPFSGMGGCRGGYLLDVLLYAFEGVYGFAQPYAIPYVFIITQFPDSSLHLVEAERLAESEWLHGSRCILAILYLRNLNAKPVVL